MLKATASQIARRKSTLAVNPEVRSHGHPPYRLIGDRDTNDDPQALKDLLVEAKETCKQNPKADPAPCHVISES